jgi:hypothetical protein
MRNITFHIFLFFISNFIFSQEKVSKEKFAKESHLHIKIGAVFNNIDRELFNQLNTSSIHVFTPEKNMYYNPSILIEFERRFHKNVGVVIGLGFMQIRQRYIYSYTGPSIGVNPYVPQVDKGLILGNVPYLNINPSFYIYNNTRIHAGLGLYKYYYRFKPMDIGNISFNLNSEGMAIYSNIGITQLFDIKANQFSLSVNYFGLTRKQDNGFQVALGIAL